jgi:hypothetical protein
MLRKFRESGGTLVLACVVSTGGVAARLNIARSEPTEQRVKASKTRGLKMPDREAAFFCIGCVFLVFGLALLAVGIAIKVLEVACK